jgi:cytochrome c556
MFRFTLMIFALLLLFPMSQVVAGESPQEQRHDLMEDSKEAAKSVGGMLKGEAPFDAELAMTSIETWVEIADAVGDLFPEGTETGYDTEARKEVWTDRAGFDAELKKFSEASHAAVAANPQSLEELKAAAGPVFKSCKSCHEAYRVDKE